MSTSESYIDKVRSELIAKAERDKKVAVVVDNLYGLIREFAEDDAYDDQSMITKEVSTNPNAPTERSWFQLFTEKGKYLKKEEFTKTSEGARELVPRAIFMVISNDLGSGAEAFTVITSPPNVLGHDDKPLSSTEIDGVIVDMQRYRAALEQDPPTQPL